jgi:hypothetical protein
MVVMVSKFGLLENNVKNIRFKNLKCFYNQKKQSIKKLKKGT